MIYVVCYLLYFRYFPKIFGPHEDQELDKEETMRQFDKLTEEVNAFLEQSSHKPMTSSEVAMGYIRVANEAMCRPIRALTQVRYTKIDRMHDIQK